MGIAYLLERSSKIGTTQNLEIARFMTRNGSVQDAATAACQNPGQPKKNTHGTGEEIHVFSKISRLASPDNNTALTTSESLQESRRYHVLRYTAELLHAFSEPITTMRQSKRIARSTANMENDVARK